MRPAQNAGTAQNYIILRTAKLIGTGNVYILEVG
jgi:hypothetical protein